MTLLAILFVSLLTLMILGVPVVAALLVASVLGILWQGNVPLLLIGQKVVSGIDNYTLLAIPLFLLTGTLMNYGGISSRIFSLAEKVIGKRTGGLAQVNVLANIMLGGMSGSIAADAGTTSKILVPMMVRAGYPKPYAAALTAAASTVAPIIPPSIAMIIYGSLSGASVGALFMAGVFPGLLMGLALAVAVQLTCRKRNFSIEDQSIELATKSNFGDAFWALLLIALIIIGIRMGVFTPSEAGAMAAVYALFVGVFLYKELKLRAIPASLIEVTLESGVILFIIAAAAPFGWLLTQSGAPQQLAEVLTSFSSNRYVFLLLVNVLLLILGCFIEGVALITIVSPILAPVAAAFGVDLVHFGIVLIINVMIGSLTPPLGQIVFQVAAITGAETEEVFREVLPFLVALLVVLMFITFVPAISLWLPGLMK